MVVIIPPCSHEKWYRSPIPPAFQVAYCASLATHDFANASRSSQATPSPVLSYANDEVTFVCYVSKTNSENRTSSLTSEPLRGGGTRFLERYGGGARKTSWNFSRGHPAEIAAYLRPSASAPTAENSSAPLVTERWVKHPPVLRVVAASTYPPPPLWTSWGGGCCCLIRVDAA